MGKKVSIIVPVYNTDRYLDRCMESLVNQSLREIEIIVVDDGSSEICAQKCDEWEKKDSRIRVIHKQNAGLGYARNTGLEYVQGEFVAFVDSDDFVEKTMYENLYREAEKEAADFVTSGFFKKYDDGSEIAVGNPGIPRVIMGEEVFSILLANMLGSPPDYHSDDYIGMSVWKGLYRSEIFRKFKVEFPSEREYISEDIVFHIEYLSHVKKAVVLQEAYYYYCQNQGSLTTTYRADRFEKVRKLYLYEEKILGEKDLLKYGHLQLERTFIANVRVCIMQEAARGKQEGRRQDALEKIRQYCADSCVQEVLRKFPYHRLPIKQRIFSIAMVKKLTGILYVLAGLQNHQKGKKNRS